jgi:hypothetical protein
MAPSAFETLAISHQLKAAIAFKTQNSKLKKLKTQSSMELDTPQFLNGTLNNQPNDTFLLSVPDAGSRLNSCRLASSP